MLDRQPGYNPSAYLTGIVNMANTGSLLMGVLLIVAGMTFVAVNELGALLIMFVGVSVFAEQAYTRIRFMRAGRGVRRSLTGGWQVRCVDSGEWVAMDEVIRFEPTEFPYVDPWRSTVAGFPGIVFQLSGGRRGEDLFPYGMEETRDQVLRMLAERHPEKGRGLTKN